MAWFTQDMAPTQYAEGGGMRFAFRRLGTPGRPPLVFFQHFTGALDDHDPALSDAFASNREVILFNNAGVASSSGTAPVSDQSIVAQRAAITAYGAAKDPSYAHLKGLELPVLVVNGTDDIVIPTINSYILQQFLPNAELILYPDANHGSHFQYPYCSSATRAYFSTISSLRIARTGPGGD
jgi:pimeloyl-ACP methyl ester carboxylesterase